MEKVVHFALLSSSITFGKTWKNVWSMWLIFMDIILWNILYYFPNLTICVTCFFRFFFLMEARYPNGVSLLNKIGTPCLLRSDLRGSFLSYYSRMMNTQIRRYEIGSVARMNSTTGNNEQVLFKQHTCSIDNIWLQRYSFIAALIADKMIRHWVRCILVRLLWCAAIFLACFPIYCRIL